MKIFGIIGSNNSISITRNYSDVVIDNVKQYIPNEKHEIVQLSDITIEMCLGCRKCFEVGHCPLDDLDDMKIIKEKMLQSDIILFASPVYAHNLSGIMKNFLDRITYWIHLMRLHNKLGIVVASTSQSGGQTVTNYLKMFLTWLGVNVINEDFSLRLLRREGKG